MKKKLISMLLALSMVLGTTPAMAQTRLTALGENNILEGIAQPMAAAAPAAPLAPGVSFVADIIRTDGIAVPCTFTVLQGGTNVEVGTGTRIGTTEEKYAAIPLDTAGHINIPATINFNGTDYPITAIGQYAFSECKALKSVTIPDGVTAIGDSAFAYCRAMTSVTIPDSVTTIGGHAFRWCEAMTSIAIPNSVTRIDGSAFGNCITLKSITIPSSVRYIGIAAFADCIALKSVTIPDGVTAIGDSAFAYCRAMTSVTIPDSVTTIGGHAFQWCDDLESITIPKSVTTIGKEVFESCIRLTEVTLLGDTEWIGVGSDIFRTCPADLKINVPVGTKNTIYKADGKWADYYDKITEVTTGGGSGSGSGSGSSSSTISKVIDNTVGGKTTPPVVTDAVKDAVAKGTASATATVTFSNYDTLTHEGIKAINAAATAATAGTNVKLNLLASFEKTSGGTTLSRITLDPAKLALSENQSVKLGVYYDQKSDQAVQQVNSKFEQYFDNKVCSVVYDQRSTTAASTEFVAKLDLSGLGTGTLCFYSYDNNTNMYTRLYNHGYRVDGNGYAHITAPFGGSIVITDKPLKSK